jgi:hypothetical protein
MSAVMYSPMTNENFPSGRQRGVWLRCQLHTDSHSIGKHGSLIFVGYSLLHLTCLPAGPGPTEGLIHTVEDASRQQERALTQRRLAFIHDWLSQGGTAKYAFAHLWAKLRGMALPRAYGPATDYN